MKFINDLGDYLSQELNSPIWVLFVLGIIFTIFLVIVVISAINAGTLEKELENEVFIKDSLQQDVERKERVILELRSRIIALRTEKEKPIEVEKTKSGTRRPSTRNEQNFSDKPVMILKKPRQKPE